MPNYVLSNTSYRVVKGEYALNSAVGYNLGKTKNFSNPIKWCHFIVSAGYATVAVITLAHVVWYFAAREVLAYPPDIYLRDYIILPFIGLSAVNIAVDFLVRSNRVPLVFKEYISLTLFLIFSFYLSLTHKTTTILFGSFTLSVFVSAIFSNTKITLRILLMGTLALLISGAKLYIEENLDSNVLMDVFVAWDMLLCSYVLARVLIRYGHDNLIALMCFYNKQQSMQEQLKLDAFTGLYNRNTFDESMQKLMEECRTSNLCLSLAVIDVDNFKRVNDVYGHATGDRVLISLAQILKSIKKEAIQVFRIGGDEFAILFKGYSVQESYQICENIRKTMEASSLYEIDKVTFSCGLAGLSLQHASPDELLRSADSALYAAKSKGRNKVATYDGPTE